MADSKHESVQYDDVAPDASAMIESMRAQGYTLATAIADLIDNSIAAHTRTVELRCTWAGTRSWIAVVDDGDGMSEQELIDAMRLGSRSPVEDRAPDDLGRFGLGLKTASFSQARRLTVTSSTGDGQRAVRRWDLDHLARPDVKGWQLLQSYHEDSSGAQLDEEDLLANGGTIVLLECLDRVVGKTADPEGDHHQAHWINEVARMQEHLAMVFHRYLSGSHSSRIRITLNGTQISPWDPFCESVHATQSFPEDVNTALGGDIRIKGYVLPHRDRFNINDSVNSAKLHAAASGPDGWNAHQGFYLYRNRRLIIAGDWLGLGPGRGGWKKEEHYKLARIRVDIPNNLDHEWQIDIKKSSAWAPSPLRDWMQGLAREIRERAKQVYAHRGGRTANRQPAGSNHTSPWITRRKAEVFSYRIDRKQPIVSSLIQNLPDEHHEHLEVLLSLIEETVPVQRIWIDTAENHDGVAEPFEDASSKRLKIIISACLKNLEINGLSELKAWEHLQEFEAFQTAEAAAVIGTMMEQDKS